MPPSLSTQPSKANFITDSSKPSSHLTIKTTARKTKAKETIGNHFEDIWTLSFKCNATIADNLIAAANPIIKANKEKTATINPRRNPFIIAPRRKIKKRISIINVSGL